MAADKKISERFGEVCGSVEPAIAARKLGISYQSAKNYLSGRPPSVRILLKIAKTTPYSIHWLLTGKGEKFAVKVPPVPQDTPLSADQIIDLIRTEIYNVFAEILINQKAVENNLEKESEIENISKSLTESNARSKVVRLDKSQIKTEKSVNKPDEQPAKSRLDGKTD